MTVMEIPTVSSARSAAAPLASAQHHLAEAALFLSLDEGLHQLLATPRRSLTVSVPVRREDGRIDVIEGYRVQHNLSRGPAKGGVRFHPGTDLDEITALAMGLTWTCALTGLPYGGAKGGVAVDPAGLTERELERLTRRYTHEIQPLVGRDMPFPTPGPDLAEGVALGVRFLLGPGDGRTVAVHGSGGVANAVTATLAANGFALHGTASTTALTADADVLVLTEGGVTAHNATGVRARTVVEAANGPITPAADQILAGKGCVVVPDILANAGGAIASHSEWGLGDLGSRLREHLEPAYRAVMALSRDKGLTLRQAAHVIAVGRVADACRSRSV